jgi:signal transduction histidine kinase
MDIAAAQLSPVGEFLAANRRFCQIVGRTEDEIRATSLDRLLACDTATLVSGHALARSFESRVRTKDGRVGRVRGGLSVVQDPDTGAASCLLLVIEEVTSELAAGPVTPPMGDRENSGQETAGRLINALEAERTRIARELHDDIGQSLAAVVVQILRAAKPVSGTTGNRHAGIPELAAKVQNIAARVGRLSHQLHSSSLEYLGLEKAVRGACREFSEGHWIPVECTCEEVPVELDDGVGLCVLRVVQEALHNVAKHARATRVTVQLAGGAEGLTLVVADDGTGFDVGEAVLAEGIGLISMRERVRFVGGTFHLTSAVGRGTRVEARVPRGVRTLSKRPRRSSPGRRGAQSRSLSRDSRPKKLGLTGS